MEGSGAARDTARAMSEENVEIVRRGIEAVNRDDWEAVLAYLDPHVEWHSDSADPDAATFRGHDGVRQFWTTWTENFQGLALDPIDLLDAGDAVVAVTRLVGRGRASGVEAERLFFSVYEFRNSKVVRYRQFDTRDEAFKAAGLSE